MPTPDQQVCRSPFTLWVNGVAHHVCSCHWLAVDATYVPRPVSR